MKILLVAINAKYIHSNLAVYSLKAYAKAHAGEWDIELAEYTVNQQKDDILMDIYGRRPDILCFSCYIWNLEHIEDLVRDIRKLRPDMPVWLGGPEVSYDAADVLARLPEVTGVIKGEGEETFAGLCRVYHECAEEAEEGRQEMLWTRLRMLEGITFKDAGGRISDNPWRPVTDLSGVPFVYHNMEEFRNKIIYYESSRGCPFSCSYCLSSVDRQLRFRDLETVKRELKFFIDQEVPQVKFVDRTFNCRHEHAIAIWKYIAEHDRGITNFHFEVAADLLNEEELKILEGMRPGLVQLEIGIQSTNPDTIREIRRVMDFDKVRNAVERIRRKGNIHQHLDLIAGLPYEDIASFARSFDDVYSLRPQQLQLGFLKVLKGSYMEEMKEVYGLVYKSRPPYEVLYTKWLSYEDTIRLKGIEEMVEVYYNSRQFTCTLEALEQKFTSAFMLYDRLSRFYEEHGYGKIQHKRSARYEILLEYIALGWPKETERFRELLIYDYYLRENAKSRPAFAGEPKVSKEELRRFYEAEETHRRYLPAYAEYDRNQIRKMTHLEYFAEMGAYVLFDYSQRDALSRDASTTKIKFWIV